jgi:hypothetical protein
MNLLDLPDILRAANIEAVIEPNFTTRTGGGDIADDFAIVWYDGLTGAALTTALDQNQPAGQAWVDVAGIWHFVCSGQVAPLANSDPANPDGTKTFTVSLELATGAHTPAQLDSLRKGTAAILKSKGKDTNSLFFHNATDPVALQVTLERSGIAGIITGTGGGFTPQVAGGTAGVNATPGAGTFQQGVFNYLYQGTKIDFLSTLFRGDLAPINDQQLITTVQAIVTASLRSFMSGPDGSFIAFFPDYFGIYKADGDPGYVLTLEDIEMIDFKIDVNDDDLATDVFVTGETNSNTGQNAITQSQWLSSNGIVNIRQKSALAALLGDDFANAFDADLFYKKFGLRPLKATFVSVNSHLLEYLQALTLFMRKWAAQYRTQVQFTFMPELYPGMRILIKSHNITVFVEEVVHTGSFETGFATVATISSPASVNGGGISGMPIGKV